MQTNSFLSRLLEPGITRRSVLFLWSISSSLVLFYFSVASDVSEDLATRYVNFAAILIGGGLSYHVLADLSKIEQNEENKWRWQAILKHLVILQIGHIAAAITIFFGIKLGGLEGIVLAVFSSLVGYFWAFFHLIYSMKKIEYLFDMRWFSSSQQKRLEETPSTGT